MHFVYILQCVDGSYYTGMTGNLELRVTQHQDGTFEGYTRSRRPVALVWSQEVETEHQAFGLITLAFSANHANSREFISADSRDSRKTAKS